MAPPLAMDTSDDFTMPSKTAPSQITPRTLLLSPPSLSSHEEKLTSILEMHDRSATDMQMLDRLSLGLVSLPEALYDVVIILCDADGSRRESQKLMDRKILETLVKSMKAGAMLRSQDDQLGTSSSQEKNEAILAGLSFEAGKGFVKPDYSAQESVPLRLGRKKDTANAIGGLNGAVSLNGKRKSQDMASGLPAGVGFDDGTTNGEDVDSDDELIDEDALLDDDDLKRPVKIRKTPHSLPCEV